MKQTVEEAAKEYYEGNNYTPFISTIMNDLNISHNKVDVESIRQHHLKKGFIAGAEWQAKQAIEILSSVLENWVHGGDADCIIAEFEEKLKNNVWNIQQKQQKGISSFDEILEANKDVLERIKQKGD